MAVSAAAACSSEGQVELRLLFPDDEALAPAAAQLAEITLVTSRPGASRRSETRRVVDRNETLELGRLELGEGVELAIELRSATQRLLGYGRSPGALSIVPGEVLEVPIRIRRPFAFVTGATNIATFDASVDARFAEPYQATITVPRPPTLVVPTIDGIHLVTVAKTGAASELSLVSTSDNQLVEVPAVSLAAAPSDAAVSPDSRWAVIGHDGAGGGVSIVDLEAALRGEAQVAFVPLGSVGAVAIARGQGPDDPDRVFALLERARGSGCPDGASNSTIIGVALDEPDQIGPTIAAGGPLHDLAAASDGTLVVADACNGRVARIHPDDDTGYGELASLSGCTAVAVQGERVWAVGSLPQQGDLGARLLLLSVDLDGGGAQYVELPEGQEQAASPGFSAPGQTAINSIDAGELHAYELAVIPGGGLVAVITEGYFHAIERGELFGFPIIPEMWMDTREYLLINAATTAIVHRVRTWCDLRWDRNSLPWLDDWRCAQAPDQDVAQPEYLPTQLSVLYGDR